MCKIKTIGISHFSSTEKKKKGKTQNNPESAPSLDKLSFNFNKMNLNSVTKTLQDSTKLLASETFDYQDSALLTKAKQTKHFTATQSSKSSCVKRSTQPSAADKIMLTHNYKDISTAKDKPCDFSNEIANASNVPENSLKTSLPDNKQSGEKVVSLSERVKLRLQNKQQGSVGEIPAMARVPVKNPETPRNDQMDKSNWSDVSLIMEQMGDLSLMEKQHLKDRSFASSPVVNTKFPIANTSCSPNYLTSTNSVLDPRRHFSNSVVNQRVSSPLSNAFCSPSTFFKQSLPGNTIENKTQGYVLNSPVCNTPGQTSTIKDFCSPVSSLYTPHQEQYQNSSERLFSKIKSGIESVGKVKQFDNESFSFFDNVKAGRPQNKVLDDSNTILNKMHSSLGYHTPGVKASGSFAQQLNGSQSKERTLDPGLDISDQNAFGDFRIQTSLLNSMCASLIQALTPKGVSLTAKEYDNLMATLNELDSGSDEENDKKVTQNSSKKPDGELDKPSVDLSDVEKASSSLKGINITLDPIRLLGNSGVGDGANLSKSARKKLRRKERQKALEDIAKLNSSVDGPKNSVDGSESAKLQRNTGNKAEKGKGCNSKESANQRKGNSSGVPKSAAKKSSSQRVSENSQQGSAKSKQVKGKCKNDKQVNGNNNMCNENSNGDKTNLEKQHQNNKAKEKSRQAYSSNKTNELSKQSYKKRQQGIGQKLHTKENSMKESVKYKAAQGNPVTEIGKKRTSMENITIESSPDENTHLTCKNLVYTEKDKDLDAAKGNEKVEINHTNDIAESLPFKKKKKRKKKVTKASGTFDVSLDSSLKLESNFLCAEYLRNALYGGRKQSSVNEKVSAKIDVSANDTMLELMELSSQLTGDVLDSQMTSKLSLLKQRKHINEAKANSAVLNKKQDSLNGELSAEVNNTDSTNETCNKADCLHYVSSEEEMKEMVSSLEKNSLSLPHFEEILDVDETDSEDEDVFCSYTKSQEGVSCCMHAKQAEELDLKQELENDYPCGACTECKTPQSMSENYAEGKLNRDYLESAEFYHDNNPLLGFEAERKQTVINASVPSKPNIPLISSINFADVEDKEICLASSVESDTETLEEQMLATDNMAYTVSTICNGKVVNGDDECSPEHDIEGKAELDNETYIKLNSIIKEEPDYMHIIANDFGKTDRSITKECSLIVTNGHSCNEMRNSESKHVESVIVVDDNYVDAYEGNLLQNGINVHDSEEPCNGGDENFLTKDTNGMFEEGKEPYDNSETNIVAKYSNGVNVDHIDVLLDDAKNNCIGGNSVPHMDKENNCLKKAHKIECITEVQSPACLADRLKRRLAEKSTRSVLETFTNGKTDW